jgi:hypothetical protein
MMRLKKSINEEPVELYLGICQARPGFRLGQKKAEDRRWPSSNVKIKTVLNCLIEISTIKKNLRAHKN